MTQTETKIDILINYIEDVFADYNEINEDTRMQLELINTALAGLQSKNRSTVRKPIGFKTQNSNDTNKRF